MNYDQQKDNRTLRPTSARHIWATYLPVNNFYRVRVMQLIELSEIKLLTARFLSQFSELLELSGRPTFENILGSVSLEAFDISPHLSLPVQ